MATDISLSAGKAIEVFRAVCDAGKPCALVDIIRRAGFPRTVTIRMLSTLVHYAFLERDAVSGLYTVNPMLLHQVRRGVAQNPLLDRVDAIMHEIVTRTGDAALFMIKSGRKALVMRRVEGSAPVRVLASEVGMELPLHCGGAPLALLAYSPPDAVEDYLAGALERRTDATAIAPEAIRDAIRQTRARGYSVGDGDLFEYVIAVGVPIFDQRGALAGAVSVGNMVQRYPPERVHEVGPILVDTVERLGWGAQ